LKFKKKNVYTRSVVAEDSPWSQWSFPPLRKGVVMSPSW